MTREEAFAELKEYESAAEALGHAMGLLYFDGVTKAPRGSAENRAETMGKLAELQYKLVTDPKFGEALEVLHGDKALSDVDARKVEELYRDYDRQKRIPMEEEVEFQMLVSKAESVWEDAKNNDDYDSYAPYLQKIFETVKRFAGYTDPEKDAYDAALDQFERGLTQEKCDAFFGALRKKIVPLLEEISKKPQIDVSPLHRHYPKEQQMKLSDYLTDVMDIDKNYFTISESEHPFTTNFTKRDVRITTHYHEDSLANSFYSVVHEGGHALYELHTGEELRRTCLGSGVSMAIHESQSRFYENIIGRSRPFISLIFPRLKSLFPSQLSDVDAERFYCMVNRSEPSLVRTEADELTYCLHIMVRYELEKMMLGGDITAKELPEAWNRLYREYLGVEVPNNRLGVLQDSHWAGGSVGYFPSYALGSAYGAQYLREMQKDLDVEAAIGSGKLTKINAWLEDKIWKYGCMKDPSELFESVCGPFDPTVYTDYLEKKYRELYKI